jgi:hypothetical protein
MTKKVLFLYLIIAFTACFHVKYSENTIGVWEIKNGAIIKTDSLNNAELATKYWTLVKSILPNEMLDSFVVSLELFTDGPSNYLAQVHALNDSNSEWKIQIDTSDVNCSWNDSLYVLYYSHTIIHEFGHLLTLNSTQIKGPHKLTSDSINYLTYNDYLRDDSYLTKFIEYFWEEQYLSYWEDINRIKNEQKRQNFLLDYYYSYQDRHVTAYSVESPFEDIAESWAFFVLDNKPKKKGVKYDKIRFFYDFPILVKYRDEIRSKLKYLPQNYLENYYEGHPDWLKSTKIESIPFKKNKNGSQ